MPVVNKDPEIELNQWMVIEALEFGIFFFVHEKEALKIHICEHRKMYTKNIFFFYLIVFIFYSSWANWINKNKYAIVPLQYWIKYVLFSDKSISYQDYVKPKEKNSRFELYNNTIKSISQKYNYLHTILKLYNIKTMYIIIILHIEGL